MAPRPRWTDDAVERALAHLLRTGVLLAAALASVGGAIFLLKYGATPTHYVRFVGEPREFSHVREIVRSALSWSGRGIIQLGLLVLIATPVVRVAASLLAFLVQRDRLYALLTAFVLALLLTSLASG